MQTKSAMMSCGAGLAVTLSTGLIVGWSVSSLFLLIAVSEEHINTLRGGFSLKVLFLSSSISYKYR